MNKLTIRSTQIGDVLAAAFRSQIAPLFLGPPGVGKTEITRQRGLAVLAQMLGVSPDELGFAEVHLASYSEVDLRGYLIPQGTESVFTRPEFFRAFDGKKGGILFLDEYPQANDELQKASSTLIGPDRCIGSHVLPPNVHVVLAGNRIEDNAGANSLLAHVVNRLLIVEVTPPTPDELVAHYAQIGQPPEIMSLVKLRPEVVFGPAPSEANAPYATARSIAAMGRILRTYPTAKDAIEDPVGMAMLSGAAGAAAAVELAGLVRLTATLPSLEAVIAAPRVTPIPKEVDLQYAMLMMIAARAKPSDANAVSEFIVRFNPNFAMVAFAALVARDIAFVSTPTFSDWASSNPDVIRKLYRFSGK